MTDTQNEARLESLWQSFTDQASKAALVTSTRVFSFGELGCLSAALAVHLERQKISKGNRIGIWCGSSPEFFLGLLAIWRLGAVAVPLDPADHSSRSREIVKKANLDCLVATTDIPIPHWLRRIRCHTIDHSQLDAGSTVEGLLFPNPDDLAAILFTSGSTGVPKGVVLTYRSILGNAASMASILDLSTADRLLFNIPFHLTSAIGHFLTCITNGATCIALDEIAFGHELIALLCHYKASAFGGAPVQLTRIVDQIRHGEASNETPTLGFRMVISSGDALPTSTIEKWRVSKPDVSIFTVYGLTELGARFCVLEAEFLPAKAGSVGRPITGLTAHLRDQKGHAITSPGAEGQVFAQGDFLMQGYFDDPNLSQTVLTPYGLATGDLGYFDESGFLYLVGRVDDVFKCSGVKVSTKFVEGRLWELNIFADVVVWPVPHPQMGLVPYAFFVPRDSVPFHRASAMAKLKDNLSSVEVPKGFVELKTIPRLANGKIERLAMQDLVQALVSEANETECIGPKQGSMNHG